jgi:hypothetical protein
MDPNAALARIRALTANGPWSLELAEYAELVELVTGLDQWLSTQRGFLPDAWNRNTPSWGKNLPAAWQTVPRV